MRLLMKLLIALIALILVISVVYVGFFYEFPDDEDDDDNGDNDIIEDTEPPTIDIITGNLSGTTGKVTTISVSFSDNENVTEATIFYKTENDNSWDSTSILEGSVDFDIPDDSADDWYYYVIVDDLAGNGPVGDPSTNGTIYYTIDVSFDVQNLEHTVFIEEGTATWCTNCPDVVDILHHIYESGDYNFYYVSMVEDKNSEAKSRLEDDYNIYGYPTVYIDGGYDVIVGSADPQSVYEDAIEKASNRDVPDLYINVTAEYNETRDEIQTSVFVQNYETQLYDGSLKVYLTERIYRYANYDGGPYYSGFLDYIINEDISISAENDLTMTEIYNISDYDVDNLMVIAVVFSSDSQIAYSNPSENENEFDAYYADATDGTLIVEGGNLPPSVGFNNPKNGRLHLLGNSRRATPNLNTFIFGRITVSAQASDDSNIDYVEIYLDNDFMANFTEEPYEWKWTGPAFGKHTLKVIAYDDEGKTSTESLEVSAFIFLP